MINKDRIALAMAGSQASADADASVLEVEELSAAPLPGHAAWLPLPKQSPSRSWLASTPVRLLALSAVAIFAQGYHLGTDDGAIYVPAVKKVFNPQLYPFGSEFFLSHGRLSLFPQVVGGSARLLHLPVDTAILCWHVLGTAFLLLAGWRIATACFVSERARWSSVATLAALLSLPVAGTALIIMDPYLTARSLSTPLTVFAVGSFLHGRRGVALACLLLTALVHPQMSVYGFVFLLLLWKPLPWSREGVHHPAKLRRRLRKRGYARAAVLPAAARLPQGFHLGPATGNYRALLHTRDFFFASSWAWWEWLGVVAPLAMLTAAIRLRFRGTLPAFQRVSAATIPLGLLSTASFLVLCSTNRFENFVRLQPMRSFHLIYIVFFLLLGGVLGEYAFARRLWLGVSLFVALGVGTFAYDRATYPSSRHIELPREQPHNDWVAAFEWIRTNTPAEAVFALDPRYMFKPGEDLHGFRAEAERSVLADEIKDSGAASLFPQLADPWERQQEAQRGWEHFRLADFERLARSYPVTWVVVDPRQAAGLSCPYTNRSVSVCRVPRVGS